MQWDLILGAGPSTEMELTLMALLAVVVQTYLNLQVLSSICKHLNKVTVY